MRINDTQRPRFVRVTQRVRAEIDYSLGRPEVIDLVGLDNRPLSEGQAIATARALGSSATTEIGALRAIARVVRRRRAIRRVVRALTARADAAARHVEIAEQHDTDETHALWELCFGSAPEAREVWLTGDDVDSFAESESESAERRVRTLPPPSVGEIAS